MTQQYKSLVANKIRRIWQFRAVSVQMNVKNKCLWKQKFLESKSESAELSSQSEVAGQRWEERVGFFLSRVH